MKHSLLLLALSCTPAPTLYQSRHFFDQFPGPYAQDVRPNKLTPRGIAVDDSALDIDLTAIDFRVDLAESCLATTFGNPPTVPTDVMQAAQCDSNTFPLPIIRRDLVIKIAPNWQLSCDGKEQLIPSYQDDAGCVAKGLTPTPDCPCYYRAGIQANKYIIVTPNLKMLKDPLIRMVTGCSAIWNSPALAACALP